MRTKRKTTELDVDFIQSRPLTPEEEKELSLYIKKRKDLTRPKKSKAA
jgi:hypothetical protein